MTPDDPTELTDSELDAVLDAAHRDLLDHARQRVDPTTGLLAFMEAAEPAPEPREPSGPRSARTHAAALAIAQRIRASDLARALELAQVLIRICFSETGRGDLAFKIQRAHNLARELNLGHGHDHGSERDIAHELILKRAFPHGSESDPAVGRAVDHALHLARELIRIVGSHPTLYLGGHDHDRALDLVRHLYDTLADDLGLIHSRGCPPDLEDGLDVALSRTRARSDMLALAQVDACGADLTGLPDVGMEVLAGVIWDLDTRWSPGLRELVAAISEEIGPGRYRVVPGGTERDPHPVLGS